MIQTHKDGTYWKVEDYLNNISYSNEDKYVPNDFSLEFITFIKLVNGNVGEENKTPVMHYRMLDTVVNGKKRVANLAHRGSAKTTLLSEYLFLYLATYGELPGFGKVNLALYVSDSVDNGVKNMRKNLEHRWNNSDFLKKYVPKISFTDIRWEFQNLEGKTFIVKGYGGRTGVRGAKEMGVRPQLAVLDDLISDEDARSATVISSIEDTVHKAVNYALHPTRNMIIWSGTPFNAKDPLYKAVESGAWDVNVYPVCESFPCERKDFKGSWEDRFDFEYVQGQYENALKLGKIDTFNQELMLRIMSDDDRMVQEGDIAWYKLDAVVRNKSKFNFYITTDFATSVAEKSDFSVISVWAYNNVGDWLWVDGICKRQLMDKNIDDLFRLAQMYRPQSVGIEVTGQQGGFVSWIQEQMMSRNIYFSLASEGNNNAPGIRPVTNKLIRFNTVLPLFKARKIFFPIERKNEPPIAEAMNELSLISVSGFKSKHDDFCFPAETPVVTYAGIKPIVEVTTNDLVLTRQGWKKVLKAWCSGNKEVITRYGITATPNHLVYTSNRGWVRLDSLKDTDILLHVHRIKETSCESLLSSMEELTTVTQTPNKQTTADITQVTQSGKQHLDCYIGIFGNSTMDQFPQTIMFTTLMETTTITPSKISFVCPVPLIKWNTQKNVENAEEAKDSKNTWQTSESYQKLGTLPQKVENGTDKTRLSFLTESCQNRAVLFAEQFLNLKPQETICAVKTAKSIDEMRCLEQEYKQSVPVYDLEVEDAHEFFAWGTLVHNCDTISMLSVMKPWKPSEEAPLHTDDNGLWEVDIEESGDARLASYIV